MKYSKIAETYQSMDATTKRIELTDILVKLFKETPKELIDKIIYLTQGKLCPDYLGLEVGIAEKLSTKAIALSANVNLDKVEYTYGQLGDIGQTAQEFISDKTQVTLFPQSLTVEGVYDSLYRIAKTAGKGSIGKKLKLLESILNNATPIESKYLMRTVTGNLRLGIADYTVIDALAIAFTGEKSNRKHLERAYNLSSDLGQVASVVAHKRLPGIKQFKICIGKPIRPMLAERLDNAKEILEKMAGKCAVEYKYDGERLQIHKDMSNMSIFSRKQENITEHYPDAIKLCNEHVKMKRYILEAEAVAMDLNTGNYLPFQELMHRRRKHGVDEAMKKYPISLNFFDILYLEQIDYTSQPYSERRRILETSVKLDDNVRIAKSITASSTAEIERFMTRAVSDGCEGIMAKDLNSVYRAGAREFAWIKLKREYNGQIIDTIDLTIVGAFRGRGRRTGKYGAFLLASYDKEDGVYRSVCKIGTGFTDEDLKNFPQILKPHRLSNRHPSLDSRMEADVWFTPKLVIETIASEITISPIHTAGMSSIRKGSGLALRFPKFTGRIREDKDPKDSTTTTELIEAYRRQLKRVK